MKNLLLITCLLFSLKSSAQVALSKGQPAPEDGVFLTKEQAAKVLAEKKAAEEICKINQQAAVAVEKNRCEYDKNLLKNELSYEKTKYDEISKLRDVQEGRLYETVSDSGDNLYWLIGGIAAGAAITATSAVGIVFFINQVDQ
jgi:hypothetical protein